MLVLGIIYQPLFLYGSTYFTNVFTKLARDTGAVNVPKGSLVSWSSIEAPDLRFLMSKAFTGNIFAWIGLVSLLILFWFVYRSFKKNPVPSKKYKEQLIKKILKV